MTTLKLGKKAARYDSRTLQLAAYLDVSKLLPVPEAENWGAHVGSWPMSLNDQVGDCTIAGAGHMVEAWRANSASRHVTVSDADVLKAYEAVSGYRPGHPETDQGAVELDALNYWRRTGVGGHKISAFAAVEPGNLDHVRAATWLFGGLYLGLALPQTAQSQVGKAWSVVPHAGGAGAPGSWGGHCVNVVAYDKNGLTVVTWGQLQRMTVQFFLTYCDEAWAVLSPDWFAATGKAPSGFDLKALQSDLAAVTH